MRHGKKRPLFAVLGALAATGAVYLGAAAAFVLMLWSVLQILTWAFGG